MPPLSPFPPSFADGPISYAVALFGDVLASALALTVLIHYVVEPARLCRAERAASHGQTFRRSGHGWLTLLGAHNHMMIGFMLSIVLRAMPDAAWMLAWGEATAATMRLLFTVDYVCDGLALVPFTVGVLLWAWSRNSISQQLRKADDYPLGVSVLPSLISTLKIGAIVVLIAAGVTIGKAGA